MKISEIQEVEVARYLRLESGEYDSQELAAIMRAAESFIQRYTGIPSAGTTESETTLDDYEDFYIAYMVLCQDMYDNRTMYTDTRYANSGNRVVDSVLGLHARNLL